MGICKCMDVFCEFFEVNVFFVVDLMVDKVCDIIQ